jgi:hypothetical protein
MESRDAQTWRCLWSFDSDDDVESYPNNYPKDCIFASWTCNSVRLLYIQATELVGKAQSAACLSTLGLRSSVRSGWIQLGPWCLGAQPGISGVMGGLMLNQARCLHGIPAPLIEHCSRVVRTQRPLIGEVQPSCSVEWASPGLCYTPLAVVSRLGLCMRWRRSER